MESIKAKIPPARSDTVAGGTTNSTPEAVSGSHRMSAEEQQRHEAFLAFVRAKEQAWATMSPAERAEAEAAWEAAVTNINEARAGHRKVFVG